LGTSLGSVWGVGPGGVSGVVSGVVSGIGLVRLPGFVFIVPPPQEFFQKRAEFYRIQSINNFYLKTFIIYKCKKLKAEILRERNIFFPFENQN
jgi:hypothetical protein